MVFLGLMKDRTMKIRDFPSQGFQKDPPPLISDKACKFRDNWAISTHSHNGSAVKISSEPNSLYPTRSTNLTFLTLRGSFLTILTLRGSFLTFLTLRGSFCT